MFKKKYTNADLLDELKAFADKLGRTPTCDEMRENKEVPSLSLYVKRFDYYSTACELAGLQPNDKPKVNYTRYENKDMLINLRKFYLELGRKPSINEIDECESLPSASLYRTRFDNIAKALKKAGVKGITKEYLKKRLEDKAREIKRMPRIKDIQNDNKPTEYHYRKHFGTLKNAIKELNITLPIEIKYYQFIADILGDVEYQSVEDNIEDIDNWFHNLQFKNDREKEILIKRYGLDGNRKRSLRDIGKEHNISYERVRQIESNAIGRIKRNHNLKSILNKPKQIAS